MIGDRRNVGGRHNNRLQTGKLDDDTPQECVGAPDAKPRLHAGDIGVTSSNESAWNQVMGKVVMDNE